VFLPKDFFSEYQGVSTVAPIVFRDSSAQCASIASAS
jgi:hypothetical protein